MSLYANQILCISVLRVASGPRVKLASCKSALNPRWFILPTVLRLFVLCLTLCYFFSCVFFFFLFFFFFFFFFFSVLLTLRLPHFGKRELILMLFVRLFDLRLFGFVCYFFLLCLGRAAVCDCGILGLFSYPVFAFLFNCMPVS